MTTNYAELREIWLAPKCEEGGDGRHWAENNAWGNRCDCDEESHSPVRYVLADHIDALTAERDEWIRKAGDYLVASEIAGQHADRAEAERDQLAKDAESAALMASVGIAIYERAIARAKQTFRKNQTRMWSLKILCEYIEEEKDAALGTREQTEECTAFDAFFAGGLAEQPDSGEAI